MVKNSNTSKENKWKIKSLSTRKTHFQLGNLIVIIGYAFLISYITSKCHRTENNQSALKYFYGITYKHFFKCSFSPTKMES